MTLPSNIADREHRKFVEDADGNVGVRLGPDAIKDSEGNKLSLDDVGRASTFDQSVKDQLATINETLLDVLFQLKLISGG